MMSIQDLSLRQHHAEILKACSEKDLFNNDRISDLPDDILVRILSLLTLKEAGSTSVLSKRWRHVWKYVPSLNFDLGDMVLYKVGNTTKEERAEIELKYFHWVEQVVNSHKAHTIDEFMIRYYVHESRKDSIDDWVTFAMKKRVKRLQLNIKPFIATFRKLPYTLPALPSSKTLISLQLNGVDVSGEVLEKLLRDCQALESLSVTTTRLVVRLKVAGPLNLKYLKLQYLFEIEHLEISAPNLVSFEYRGEKISWPLISSPKLVEFTIGGYYGGHIKNDFSELSSISSQIEVLTILSIRYERDILSRVFPEFQKLKMLDFKFDPDSDVELFRLRHLLKNCPHLHKFALELQRTKKLERTKKTRKLGAFSHQHLTTFEFRGFAGHELDIAFILYLTNDAVLAKKLIVLPYSWTTPRKETQLIAEKEAERLRTIIKPGLELEIRKKPIRNPY